MMAARSAVPSPASMDERLPLRRKVALASGDYGFNLVWHSIELFLLFYYTDVMGLPPLFAGLILTLGSLCDALVDPIIGALADRTRTRWGRFRPWVVGMAPLVAVGLAATFYTPDLRDIALMVYALVAHLFLRTVYTSANIPFIALSARVTRHAADRSTIAGLRMQFAGLASLTIALGVPVIVDQFPGDPATGHFVAAAVAGALLVPVLANAMRLTPEAEEPSLPLTKPKGISVAIKDDLISFWLIIRRNGALLRVLLAIILVSTAMTVVYKTILYYYKYYVGEPDLGRFGLASSAVSMLIVAPIWAQVANRSSKRTAWFIASIFAIAGSLGLYLAPPSPWLAVALLFLLTIGTTGHAVLFWAMIPDTVEVNELAIGERHEAKTFGFAIFARKGTLAINALLIGSALTAAGFAPNVAQSSVALDALRTLIGLVPLICTLLSLFVIWGYRLGPREHEQLKAAIALRDQGRESRIG